MKNKLSLIIVLFLISSVLFIQCQKKEEKKFKITKYEVKDDYVISKAYAVSGFNLNDTVNNIYGAMLIPISKNMENDINIKPITSNIGSQMQEFVDEVRKRSTKGYNFIEIRPIYFIFHDNELYSCLVKKTISFDDKDTLISYNTVNYNYMENMFFGFDDIFQVNQANYLEFIELLGINPSQLNLSGLRGSDFNIEADSISFNIHVNNSFIRYKQSIEELRPYFKDKDRFSKE